MADEPRNAKWEDDPNLRDFREFLRDLGVEIERFRKLRRGNAGLRAAKNSGQPGRYTLEWMDTNPDRIDVKYFQGLISGKKNFTMLTLFKICRKLNIHPAEVLGGIKWHRESGLRLLGAAEAKPYENSIPVFDLGIAAGAFSPGQLSQSKTWMAFEKPERDLFVCQVLGDSMDKVIPDGSWCLFRLNPGGSRQNRVVLAQQSLTGDPEDAGRYTVKRYESQKSPGPDDDWRHTQIVLKPQSHNPRHQPIVLRPEDADKVRIIGEFIRVLEFSL